MSYKEVTSAKEFKALIQRVARNEKTSPASLAGMIEKGECVITLNRIKKLPRPCAIGKGLSTKVNVNIGTSTDKVDLAEELRKLKVALELGTDTVMDLSVGG